MLKKLKVWMEESNGDEKKLLAKSAGVGLVTLYQIAAGKRRASAAIAAKVSVASVKMAVKSKGRLPVLLRSDISPVCAACPYSPKCKKSTSKSA